MNIESLARYVKDGTASIYRVPIGGYFLQRGGGLSVVGDHQFFLAPNFVHLKRPDAPQKYYTVPRGHHTWYTLTKKMVNQSGKSILEGLHCKLLV